MWTRATTLACSFLVSTVAAADVVRSTDDSFEIRIETTVPVSPTMAYEQFLAVSEWWSADHTWFGNAAGLSIEPRAGGCFCEEDGDRTALHMTVSYVDPGAEIRMLGGLGPLQQLSLHGAMTWSFETDGERTARIVLVYRVSGYHPDGLKALSAAVDGVLTMQVKRLQAQL